MRGKLLLALGGTLCQMTMASEVGKTSTRLYTALSAEQKKEDRVNFVFSPYSILAAFHMAQLGAAGDTVQQMNTIVPPDETFKLPKFELTTEDGKQAVQVESANRLYAHKDLEESMHFLLYSKEVEQLMDSEAQTLNFADSQAAAQEINTFVHQHTHGHIKQIVESSSLSDDTKLVLVNALYFKAPWLEKFAAEQTFEGVFHAQTAKGREDQTVKFMKNKFERGFTYLRERGMTAFSINYADHRLRFYLYMPDNMQKFEKQIAKKPEKLEQLAERVALAHKYEEEMELSMPKFKLAAEGNRYNLKEVFQRMGVELMFDPQRADFSEIAGDKAAGLFVSQYVHQADIAVDEDGTEAAGASMMGIMLMSAPMEKTVLPVVVDKPFIFQVRFMGEGSDPYVLFAGRVADVQAAQ